MEYGEYFIRQARNDLSKNHSYASRALGDTMEADVQIYDDYFRVSIILQDYWKYVDDGRKPGKFPPPNKIKEWIRIKPIRPKPLKDPVESMSYAIQKKIKKKKGYAPPREVLVNWIEKKGIKPREYPTTDQLAFLIGRKIATKGIDPAPFFKKNIKPTEEHFEEAIALAIDEDIARWIETEVLQKAVYEDLFSVLK